MSYQAFILEQISKLYDIIDVPTYMQIKRKTLLSEFVSKDAPYNPLVPTVDEVSDYMKRSGLFEFWKEVDLGADKLEHILAYRNATFMARFYSSEDHSGYFDKLEDGVVLYKNRNLTQDNNTFIASLLEDGIQVTNRQNRREFMTEFFTNAFNKKIFKEPGMQTYSILESVKSPGVVLNGKEIMLAVDDNEPRYSSGVALWIINFIKAVMEKGWLLTFIPLSFKFTEELECSMLYVPITAAEGQCLLQFPCTFEGEFFDKIDLTEATKL